jgi:hypothetical protein
MLYAATKGFGVDVTYDPAELQPVIEMVRRIAADTTYTRI